MVNHGKCGSDLFPGSTVGDGRANGPIHRKRDRWINPEIGGQTQRGADAKRLALKYDENVSPINTSIIVMEEAERDSVKNNKDR